ncbi:MAG: four helix bundle protein [Chryseobacterium sp.]|jgi:four helix bundle protein|uniref:four helix bundle protein n=1 Tax=Chryseobacterium sp. TaxID=1871047 RepID=UPI00281EC27D|nr:four helix bundle protein [Chryseobacterium sp.]MDR2237063.1 four helix bundle protein [Chryseobacterium sp.]
MSFKFEKLVIWQKSMDFAERIFNLTVNFPKDEIFSLTSQIRRASDSIALNISEGSILQSNKEFKKFLSYSIRSLGETVTCLYKAKNRKYMVEKEFDEMYKECYHLMNQIIAFRNQLKD